MPTAGIVPPEFRTKDGIRFAIMVSQCPGTVVVQENSATADLERRR